MSRGAAPLLAMAMGLLVAANFSSQQTKQGEGIKMESGIPFEIRLSAEKGTELRAVLVNRSEEPQMILYEPLLQPSRLDLIGAGGKEIEPFDSRSIQKYDGTVYCRQFQRLASGKEIDLGAVRFKRAGRGFAGAWGPFEFEALPPGGYTARVVWESETDRCLDEKTQQIREVASVWLGRLESNEVRVQLR